jgi:hypothetical protein
MYVKQRSVVNLKLGHIFSICRLGLIQSLLEMCVLCDQYLCVSVLRHFGLLSVDNCGNVDISLLIIQKLIIIQDIDQMS